MASIFEQYGIKEVADVTFYEISSEGYFKPVLFIDTMKVSTLEGTAENVEAKGGKANPALISWDFGREITLNMEDALFSPKSLAIIQGGGNVTVGTALAPVRVNVSNERVTATGTTSATAKITLEHTPVANTIYVYEVDDNGYWKDGVQLHDVKITAKEVMNDTGKTELEFGVNYAVFYQTEIADSTAQVIEISASTFPGTYRVVGDTYARNRATGRDEYFQFVVHRAKMSAENTITLEAEGDASTFNMSMRVLRDTGSQKMIDLIKYSFAGTSTTEGDLNPSDMSV